VDEASKSVTAGALPVGDGASVPPGSLAEKIDMLFRRTRPPGQAREYSYDQVAETIAANGGPTISANYVYMLRRGIRDNPTKRHLEALAEFFSVPPGYFFEQDADPQHDALQTLARHGERVISLVRALDTISNEGATVLRDIAAHASQLRTLAARPDPERTDPVPARPRPGSPVPSTISASLPAVPAGDELRSALDEAREAISAGSPAVAVHRLNGLLAHGRLSRSAEDQILYTLALAHERQGDLEAAIRVLCPMYRRALSGSSDFSPGSAGAALSYYYHQVGDLDAAIRTGETAMAASERLGLGTTYDHVVLAINVMWANYGLGNLAQFSAMADHFLDVSREHGLTAGEAGIYWNAALVDASTGRFGRAVDSALQALAHLSQLEADRNLPRIQVDVAWCLLRADPARAEEAAGLLERVRPYLDELGDVVDLGCWHTTRALAHLRLAEPQPAEALSRQAVVMLHGYPGQECVRAHMMLGDAVASQGRPADALEHYRQAVLAAEQVQVPRYAAELFRELADRIDRLEPTEAATLYRKALNAARVPGSAIALETALPGRSRADLTAVPAGELTAQPHEAP
jgi:tetratricopeptide (TPR) repeat protein/transcriptional regulator with XRE-family HTH domain